MSCHTNLEDKNSQTCQLAAVDQGLRKISDSLKEHCIQNWGHCLSHLDVELGLGPKIKLVANKLNYNFY